MNSIYKTYKHNPPHLFIPGAKYFVTASTFGHKPYFREEAIKYKMLEILQTGCQKYNWKVDDWVILDDHYHLMLKAAESDNASIALIINNFHKFSAMFIRKYKPELKSIIKIFYNYWDTCITYERSYYARINYIYLNPVKHGYVTEAQNYKFGSYYFRFKKGENGLKEILSKFPSNKLDLEYLD